MPRANVAVADRFSEPFPPRRAILNDIPADLSEAYIPPLGEPLMTLWRRSAVVQGAFFRITSRTSTSSTCLDAF